LSVGLVARFRIEALKAILSGGLFRSSITLDMLVARSCDHVSGIVADQFPSPTSKVWFAVPVFISAKVESAVIAIKFKFTAHFGVVIDWSDFVFQKAPLESII
jgi:hypothetical protein